MKSFNRAARTYESFGFIQREMAGWLAEWLPPLHEGSAMEVGAGTGFFTNHLVPWNGPFLATDASPAMVELGASQLPQLDWRVALSDDLPDVSVQWIFSSSYLQWVDNPARVLHHWGSRLEGGGRILGGLFARPTLPELHQVLPGSEPLQWRTPAEWEKIASRAGLKLLRTEAVERLFLFPSALELLRTLHRTGAAPTRRTSAVKLRKAIREYDRRFAYNKGVRSTWTFYRFEAAKAGAEKRGN